LPEQLPQSKHPLAAVHPKAFRACVSLSRIGARCARGILIGIFLGIGALAFSVIGLVFSLSFLSPVAIVLIVVSFLFVFGSFFCVAMSFFVRWVIIAFFFTRYSLAQLLGVVLCTGACGTGVAALPDRLKVLPCIGFWLLVTVVFLFVADQDPEGSVIFTPDFLRRALAQKKGQAESKNTEHEP